MAVPATVVAGGGTFLLSSGATLGITSPLGITSSGATGNVQTTTRTFNTGANYIYNGSAAQVTGTGLPATVNNLTIINAAGVSLTASTVVTGTLGLTTGDLTTPGAFTVSQPTSAPASTGTGDVVGTVIRTGAFTGGTAYTFGNPFNQISVSGGVLPTPISVKLVKSAPAAKANAVTRTYTITPTGGSAYSATVQLHYLDTEINGNTEANLVLWHLNGSWSSAGVNSLDNSNNWVQQTGIAAGATLTGDWAIGNAVGSATQVRVETAADGSGTIVPRPEPRLGLLADGLRHQPRLDRQLRRQRVGHLVDRPRPPAASPRATSARPAARARSSPATSLAPARSTPTRAGDSPATPG